LIGIGGFLPSPARSDPAGVLVDADYLLRRSIFQAG
jgi:hypothetical protein